MNIAVIGEGGREHALAHALTRSPDCSLIVGVPGNPGIAELGKCLYVPPTDTSTLIPELKKRNIDLVIIGPEKPLAAGLADQLRAAGTPTFGPSQAAARLESDKAFTRALARELEIKQPLFSVCTSYEMAREGIRRQFSHGDEVVVKANGLAAGKGVVVCDTMQEALAAAHLFQVDRIHGEAGSVVLVEDRLHGQEVSLMVLTDGERVVPLLPAQDYKRACENDAGPNTGGMGAFAPVPFFSPAMVNKAVDTIARPILRAMAQRGTPFQGCLYLGLMLVPSSNGGDPEPYLIELNARFGDPETQVVLPLLKSDFVELALACAHGDLTERPLEWSTGCTVAVTLASPGYPDTVRVGHFISGVSEAKNQRGALVFHAGTRVESGQLITNGGRVLTVVGTGNSFPEARTVAYEAAGHIHFEGMQRRSDIAATA